MPYISVIIPTYNRAHLIGRSIQSVLNQTYNDFEIIVVDDGSTDNTQDIVANFIDIRIKYMKHAINKGTAAAINSGIKLSRGRYIAFQDDDDEWLSQKLEKQIKVFESSTPETGVVYTDMLRVNAGGNTKYWHSPHVIGKNIIDPRTSDYQVMGLGGGSSLILRDCLDAVGLLDESLPRFLDLDLFIRLSKQCAFAHIQEPLVKYYATEGSISTNADALVTARNLLIQKYSSEVNNHRRFMAKQYYAMGVTLCADRQMKQGKNYLFKAVKEYPISITYIGTALLSLMGWDVYIFCAACYRKFDFVHTR